MEGTDQKIENNTKQIYLHYDGSTFVTDTPLIQIAKSARVLKALRSLGIFWTLALGAAFIPMLHFVLVPLFMLAGVFFAANSYADHVQLDAQKLVCPKCNQPLKQNTLSDQFPKWINCPTCSIEIKVLENPA